MDIPFGKKPLEIRTSSGEKFISLDHVQSCIREACGYCFDSTAEFSDISVGSARFGNDWEEMRGWNQLIVRTKKARSRKEKNSSKEYYQKKQICGKYFIFE